MDLCQFHVIFVRRGRWESCCIQILLSFENGLNTFFILTRPWPCFSKER